MGGSGIIVIFDEQWVIKVEMSLTRQTGSSAGSFARRRWMKRPGERSSHDGAVSSRLHLQTSSVQKSVRRLVTLGDRQTWHSFALPDRAQHGD